jgi:hypothetical protein
MKSLKALTGGGGEPRRLRPFINLSNVLFETIRSMCNEEGSPLRSHLKVG